MTTRNLFFSLDNPVIFSLLLIITLGIIVYLFYVNIYKPLQHQHKLEKEVLELKNSRLMAMFAELDPEPLYRFNDNGEIIFTNEAGSRILEMLGLKSALVTHLLPVSENMDYGSFIRQGNTFLTTVNIGGEFYDITMKGIPETGFGQIYCNDITVRRNAQEELELSRRRLRELSNHLQKVQEAEKKKISRELHDNFGQILTSVKINIDMLREKYGSSFSNDFNEIALKLEEARKEIREISYRLRPRVLDDFGLSPALKMLCDDTSKASGIKGCYQAVSYDQKLDPETETNIYRIVQEALNNITKHSKAEGFNVQLIRHSEKIVVIVEDDGVGYDPKSSRNGDPKKGMGTINMQERALSMNGRITINSNPGKGTELIIEVPLEEQNETN